MDYQNYTVIDFTMAAAAADESFFQWVWQPDKRSDEFWNEWLAQQPHKREEVEEARWLILSIREFMQIMNLGANPPAVFKSGIQTHYRDLMTRINKTLDVPPDHTSQNKEMQEKDNEGKS